MFIYCVTHKGTMKTTQLCLLTGTERMWLCARCACEDPTTGRNNSPSLTVCLKSTRTHLELLNLISAVLFVLRCALKWWASWLLPVPPIHNKGRPDEDRGCQSPISVPFIMADLEALTALNY